MNKPKVAIGLPTMNSVHTYVLMAILGWMSEAMATGDYNLCVIPTCGVQPVDNARNKIVEEFLQSDCTHLFFVDSDTIPPANAIRKLLAADKDIVSALTPIIEYNPANKDDIASGFYKKWNCVGMNDTHVKEPYIGLIPIKGAGGSCIMIRRKVFETVPFPWYRFVNEDDDGKPARIGEDIYFCAMAIKAGFQPYADTSIVCGHNKSIIWK